MNQAEATTKREELGLPQDLTEAEIQKMDTETRNVWLRSKTLREEDGIPQNVLDRSQKRLETLQKALDLSREHAS